MNWLKDLKISSKLLLAFGLVLAFMATNGLQSIGRLAAVADKSRDLSGNWLPSVYLLAEADAVRQDLRVAQYREVLARTPQVVAEALKSEHDRLSRLEKLTSDYAASYIRSSEQRAIWDRFTQQWRDYMSLMERVHTLVKDEKLEEAQQLLMGDARDAFHAAGDTLNQAIELNHAAAVQRAEEADQIYRSGRTHILEMIAGATLCGLMIALFVSRAVSKPLGRAVEVFERIASGHLDNEIEPAGRDETGVLLERLREMQTRMRQQLATERKTAAENKGQLTAIDRAQAIMELQLDGTVLGANDNFVRLLGFSVEEIRGRPHSMLVDPGYRNSEEYRRFWEKLRRGEYEAGQYLRIGKSGREIWIQASYNPILDGDGKPYKIVEYSTDVTSQVLLTKQMQMTVEQTQQVIKSATAGELSRRLDTSQLTGDLRAMADGINTLLDNMTEIIQAIKAAALEINRGAEEISSGNANLSQRTEEQSSSLEETASSMEEMTTTVKQNADNAGEANQLALAARTQAERGGSVVGKAVSAMSGINEASRKIADIIGVIDEIAFQTNLLALNAAVEAARAGEQGRGFAVVASEVRSLAGRSATAAKEIKELIQDSMKKVEGGSALVTESGHSLEQIVSSVKKVADIIAEIASASREQSSGIEQVNRAVMQMDEMTQQNAALVEQSTAASQAMAGQARQLTQMMARYQVGDSSASTAVGGTLRRIASRR